MSAWWSLADIACRPADACRTVALKQDEQRLSHADFLARIGCWQAAFSAHPQRQWAIYLNDTFDFAAAIFAAWHAGKTVVLPGDDRSGTVRDLLQSGYALAGDLPGALQASGQACTSISCQILEPRQAKIVVFTSGSQGHPEAIEKRLEQLLSEIEALEQAFGHLLADPQESEKLLPVVWATVSHQHIYGLLFLVLWPLAAGRPFALRRLLYPEDLAACLGPQPSVLVTTPAHLKRLGVHHNWQAARQGLWAVFSSGGPLSFDASNSVATAFGRVPIEVFGSSETGGVAWRQCLDAKQPWQPFSDVQWSLVEGCLAVCSPRLQGESWVTTTDRAEPAEPAGFTLLGRADRIVKIEEKRVSLSAIERCLLSTDWVQEAKALVIDTPIGLRVAVVAVPTPLGWERAQRGRHGLGALLRKTLADELQALALPRRWRFLQALPTNAQGKSTEALLTALFTAPASSPGDMPEVQWHARGETEALASLAIHASLCVFEGHFDVAPVLPGVAQLDWALALGRQCFAMPEHFVRLEALKFVHPVQPGVALMLALQFKPQLSTPNLCSLTFNFYSDEGIHHDHASGRSIWSYAPKAAHV